jgi:hypothetical protein
MFSLGHEARTGRPSIAVDAQLSLIVSISKTNPQCKISRIFRYKVGRKYYCIFTTVVSSLTFA